jgi:predicted phosphodiesterase
MRVAVLADIHGNLEALEAVLIAIEREAIQHIVCLGDVVGYGPDPLGCIYRLQEVNAAVLLGNHDQAMFAPRELHAFNALARPSLVYARQLMGEEELRYLQALPLLIEGVEGMDDVVFAHASPQQPAEWDPLYMHSRIARSMDELSHKIAFVGHTHYAGIHCKMRGRTVALTSSIVAIGPHQYLVNPGSVGQPRDGDWRASYAIWDTGKNGVELQRVEYALKRTQEKMNALEFPQFTIDRLAQGE